jgi:hypothetical protein
VAPAATFRRESAYSVVARTVVARIRVCSAHVRAVSETGSDIAWAFDIAIGGVALDERMVTWRSGNERYDRNECNEDGDELHIEMTCCIRTASGVYMKEGSCVVRKVLDDAIRTRMRKAENDNCKGLLGKLSLLYRNMRGYLLSRTQPSQQSII